MGRMKYGVSAALEEEANRLIRNSLVGVTRHCEKSDILTPWKEAERYRREVYVASGSPDASVRKGMYHRVANTRNPGLNSRDGLAQARPGQGFGNALSAHVIEHGTDGQEGVRD
jgi:hypothetical protein